MLMLWLVLDLMLFYVVKIEDVQYVHRTCKYWVIAIVHPEWSHPNLCSHRISRDKHNVWGLILYVYYSRSLYSWKPRKLWQVLATGMRVNLRSAFIIWRVIWRELQQLVSHFLPGWRLTLSSVMRRTEGDVKCRIKYIFFVPSVDQKRSYRIL